MRSRYIPRLKLGQVVTVAVIVLLVPLLAAVNALVGPYSTLPYVALAAFVAFSALPLDFLVLVCFVAGSVLAGLLEYFAGISQGFWLPYLMGVLFALRAVAERLRLGTTAPGHAFSAAQRVAPAPHPVAWISAVYFATAVFGLAIALPPLPQVIVASKNYFFLWGLLLVLLWSPWRIASSSTLWTTVVVVACMQWPFVLYQRFVVAARRHEAAAWDAVVGTFGGNAEGGGRSATMAFVSCLAIAVVISRMREKRINGALGGLLILMCLAPIALGEVKAAFVWLAVVFLILFARQIAREPFRAGLSLLMGAVLLVGLGLIYKTTYQGQRGGPSTVQEIFEKQIKYALDPNEFNAHYHRLGRLTALVFWWERHDLRSDPMTFLVGHGLGASRSSSSLGMGQVARKLPFIVDSTAISALLWDSGLLGTLSFTAILGVAGVGALRVSQRPELTPPWRETTVLAGCVLVMATLGLPYNSDAIDSPVVQTLIIFAIAQVMLARREIAARGTAAGSVRGMPAAAKTHRQTPATVAAP